MSSDKANGRITSGIPADSAAVKTLEFIEKHIAAWRDDPTRRAVERERDLNSQLCKFLNVAARQSDFAMVHFHHEEPQGVQHSADFSANPVDGGWIEGSTYTIYEPILVVEGKRLPTPGSGREREYVTSEVGNPAGGGIQRFKLGLHGSEHRVAGMVGYVQVYSCNDWTVTINEWIDELTSSSNPPWSADDRLNHFRFNRKTRQSCCESEHTRQHGVSPTIRLMHLWVEM